MGSVHGTQQQRQRDSDEQCADVAGPPTEGAPPPGGAAGPSAGAGSRSHDISGGGSKEHQSTCLAHLTRLSRSLADPVDALVLARAAFEGSAGSRSPGPPAAPPAAAPAARPRKGPSQLAFLRKGLRVAKAIVAASVDLGRLGPGGMDGSSRQDKLLARITMAAPMWTPCDSRARRFIVGSLTRALVVDASTLTADEVLMSALVLIVGVDADNASRSQSARLEVAATTMFVAGVGGLRESAGVVRRAIDAAAKVAAAVASGDGGEGELAAALQAARRVAERHAQVMLCEVPNPMEGWDEEGDEGCSGGDEDEGEDADEDEGEDERVLRPAERRRRLAARHRRGKSAAAVAGAGEQQNPAAAAERAREARVRELLEIDEGEGAGGQRGGHGGGKKKARQKGKRKPAAASPSPLSLAPAPAPVLPPPSAPLPSAPLLTSLIVRSPEPAHQPVIVPVPPPLIRPAPPFRPPPAPALVVVAASTVPSPPAAPSPVLLPPPLVLMRPPSVASRR